MCVCLCVCLCAAALICARMTNECNLLIRRSLACDPSHDHQGPNASPLRSAPRLTHRLPPLRIYGPSCRKAPPPESFAGSPSGALPCSTVSRNLHFLTPGTPCHDVCETAVLVARLSLRSFLFKDASSRALPSSTVPTTRLPLCWSLSLSTPLRSLDADNQQCACMVSPDKRLVEMPTFRTTRLLQVWKSASPHRFHKLPFQWFRCAFIAARCVVGPTRNTRLQSVEHDRDQTLPC